MLEQAGADGDVGPGEAQAVVDGADRVADLQPQVPEAVEHALDQALAPGRLLVGGEEQQVDVGEGRHLGAAVAADRDGADPLGGGGLGQRMQPARRHVEGQGDDPVDQPGVVVDRAVRLARGGGDLGGDRGAPLGVGAAQHGDHRGADRAAVRRGAAPPRRARRGSR